jgi:hypothetical protein
LTKVHVHDPTKALLAVVVPLLSAAVLGVALIVAFAQSSGAPPYKPAAVSPPSLPALSSGAAPGTNHLCAPRERLPTSLPPGSGVVTISPDSTSVTALWLPGLDPSDCQAAITRGGRALAVELAAALDGEPAVGTGIYACPLDNGSSVVLYFGYGEGRASEAVSVALSGCRFISDPGRKSRWWLKPGRAPLNFGQLLARLAPNPWRSNILTALQAS